MRKWAALALFLVAGCSDPSTARLEPGAEAMIFSTNGAVVGVRMIDSGTRVRVVSDGEDDDDDPEYRKVVVRVLEGPEAGHAGEAYRLYLRPLK